MPKRIYIGNLPHDTIEREVQALFQGSKIRSIHLHVEDKVRKSAIVMLEDDKSANRYLASLRGKMFKGRKLIVNLHI